MSFAADRLALQSYRFALVLRFERAGLRRSHARRRARRRARHNALSRARAVLVGLRTTWVERRTATATASLLPIMRFLLEVSLTGHYREQGSAEPVPDLPQGSGSPPGDCVEEIRHRSGKHGMARQPMTHYAGDETTSTDRRGAAECWR